MIKKWNQFINESIIPGEDQLGSVRISLDQEEAGYFSEEPILGKLISDQKVALYDNELWYWEDDLLTINILKQYFPEEMDRDPIGSDEENESVKVNESNTQVNENIETNDGSIANHEVLVCPYCKCEQGEHPENIFQDDFAVYDCDECGKEFDCSRDVEVTFTYYTKKIKGVE